MSNTNLTKKRTCPVCKKSFEAEVGQVFCKTSCRRKAGNMDKYYKNYMVGKV